MEREESKKIFDEMLKYIPTDRKNGMPLMIDYGEKGHVWDVDGNEYIDYICSGGSLILGHYFKEVFEGAEKQLRKGISFGSLSLLETEMGKLIAGAYKEVEKVKLTASEKEAVYGAITLARNYTHRDKILLISGKMTKKGRLCEQIVIAEDALNEIEKIFQERGSQLAAVLVEPVWPERDSRFLKRIRNLTLQHGTLLIYDERLTGFRTAYGSVASQAEGAPDIVCLGRVIGGGMPLGAYGGKEKFFKAMEQDAFSQEDIGSMPSLLALLLGKNQLEYLKVHPEVYQNLNKKAAYLVKGIQRKLNVLGLSAKVGHLGGTVYLSLLMKNSHDGSLLENEAELFYQRYRRMMLEQGILIGRGRMDVMFLCTAHTYSDLNHTIYKIGKALEKAAAI